MKPTSRHPSAPEVLCMEAGNRQGLDGPPESTSSRRSNAGTCMELSRLDERLRSSIVDGVVVFLSLFDDWSGGSSRVLSAAKCVRR